MAKNGFSNTQSTEQIYSNDGLANLLENSKNIVVLWFPLPRRIFAFYRQAVTINLSLPIIYQLSAKE